MTGAWRDVTADRATVADKECREEARRRTASSSRFDEYEAKRG
jgi:hypothetical protein